jgi:hypothetical protein
VALPTERISGSLLSVAPVMNIPGPVAGHTTPGPLTEVTLPDGTAALIWPLLDNDRDLLRQGFAQLSPESRQQRFLTSLPELSDAMLRLLVDDVDGVDHVALLLTVLPEGGTARQVGVGRLVRYPGEPAVMTALLARRPAGVTGVRTTVAADNRASLAMLSRRGKMTTHRDGPGVLTVQIGNLAAAA